MMKLKHLFNNEELALLCLNRWYYDEDSIELFKYFRISSNAIYPFKHKGKLLFLRFSPKEEKSLATIQNEVQIMETLIKAKVPVPNIISSKNNLKIETLESPWGIYYALVFEGITGNGGLTLEDMTLDDDIIFKLGSQLGHIHNVLGHLTQETCSRNSIEEILQLTKNVFKDNPSDSVYLKIAEQLADELAQIPKNTSNYGLLHYDYELDNLILNKDDSLIYTIDFDDACYGWYDLDIMIAIKNIIDESSYESYDYVEQVFLKGYASKRAYSPLSNAERLTLIRFEKLYRYFRMVRTLEEKWPDEPVWMQDIRSKLNYVSKNLSKELLKA